MDKLTAKQRLVVEDIARKIANGEKPSMVDSTEKFYDVSSRHSAEVISSRNAQRRDFRIALLEELDSYGIGRGGKISQKLAEGLEAIDGKGNVDYNARLKYVQEIHKILGVYAPTESKTMNLNLDISGEELDEKIKQLQKELE